MEFNGLFGQVVTAKPKAKQEKARGCDACPMNNVPGIKKIMGRIRGREILVVGKSPGPEDNDAGFELTIRGRPGLFIWEELDKVGITRKDCDITNVVRCFPADATEGSYDVYLKMRTPTNEEIHCCSVHTEKAMEQVTAKHILILGQVAAKAFLETRTVPSKKIFWSEKHRATVYLADDPAFFIRGYAAEDRLRGFRSSLQALADAWRGNQASGASESPQEAVNGIHRASTFAYMRKQRYIWVATREKAIKAAQLILARKHRDRAAVDVEDDDGKIFACGFCIRPGITFVFDMTVPIVREVARRLLQNPTLRKVMQYGCTDVEKLADEKIFVHGFDFDTNIGAYFMQPGLGEYGLTAIAERQFPEFTGYKDEVVIELLKILPQDTEIPKGFAKLTMGSKGKWMGAHGHYHLSKLPPDTIRLYNGADCDLTKRAELSQRDAVECPAALMNIYIDLTFVLQDMQKNGPIFDYEQHRALETIYPWKEKKLLDKIREVTGDPEFKPGSPPQVFDYIYNQLKLKYPFAGAHGKNAKPNTQKKTLLMLTDRHPFPQLEIDWRKINKGNSTYIVGYKYCADLNGGRLRTKWNATGTASGRLSSGGKRQDPGVVNFQNIHGDPQMQNMCVADKRWRRVYRAIESICRKFPEDKWERIIEKWIRKHMPDLQTFLILDYGQVEVRAAAQISGDENLIADCESGDIHTTVGVVMTGWSADQIQHDKLTRTRTKNVHFGILFGISKENLYDFIVAMTPPPKDAEEAKWREEHPLTREFVYAAFDRYFARYTKIAEYIENQREFAREHGYCETLFGLRRKLNVNEDDDHDYYEMAESDDRGTYWGNQCVNCVDLKTEALTQRGWVKGMDLRPGDVLLTKNADNGRLEWQACTDVKLFPDYDKPLMEFKSRSFSAASTLDHRWLTGNGKCTLTKDITQDKRIHRTGEYLGPAMSSYSDDFVRLAGWFLTDGSTPSKPTDGKNYGYSNSMCMLWQSQKGNPKKVKMIDALLKRMATNENLRYRTQLPKNRKRDEVVWFISGLYGSMLRAIFPTRELTASFLIQLTARQLEILLHTMILGDGSGSTLNRLHSKSMGNSGQSHCKITFGTGSMAQLNAFQMLVSLTGRVASQAQHDSSKYNATRKSYPSMMNNPQASPDFYQATICRRKFAHIYPEHKRMIANKGVWCPMVPNTYFVARRDGCVFVTGNTPVQGTAHQVLECALVNLRRQPEKYKLLGVPSMEVHDALYMMVPVLQLMEAKRTAQYLLEHESLNTIKSDFPHIDWRVPIATEAEAGLRLGTKVELDKEMSVGQFMLAWFKTCKKQMEALEKQLDEVIAG